MKTKCLYCYGRLNENESDFHPACSMKIFGSRKNPLIDFDSGDLEKLAGNAINRSFAIPGVQKKLSLELEKSRKGSRITIVGVMGNFILKPASENYFELPENEDLTMHLATLAGIETAKHSLIKLGSGEIAYITKRFDRYGSEKIPVEDMNQISGNLTSDKYSGSVEKVAKLIEKYSTHNMLEVIKFYKLIVFSFLTGNADMHLKNYSLMKDDEGHVKLSPAYDLVSTKLAMPEDKEESALTINGKKSNLNINDFFIAADTMRISEKVRDKILIDLKKKIPLMQMFIKKSFLSGESKSGYLKIISDKAKILKML